MTKYTGMEAKYCELMTKFMGMYQNTGSQGLSVRECMRDTANQ